MKLVELAGIQLDASTGANLLLLREHDAPHRLLPIVVGGVEAASIAIAVSGQRLPRPLTHDVMAALVESLDGHLDAVEVTDLLDGAFLAQLSVSGPTGARHLDTRPSDAIALAVRLHAPLFVSDHVLDAAGAMPELDLDDQAIESEVEVFKTFLEELEPEDFLDRPDPADDSADDESLVDDESLDDESLDDESLDDDPMN